MKQILLLILVTPLFTFGQWIQIGANIDGEATDDISGNSVSISAAGLTVAIGASGNDDGGAEAGHVRVYKYIGGVWVQQGQDIDGEAAEDLSGLSISMSSDGLTVAIGAMGNDDGGADAGHVRVYKYIGGVWVQQGQDIDGEATGDGAGGVKVSMSADGLTVAIGARFNDGLDTDAGHVRVYKYIGGVWTQQGQDIDGERASDQSGFSVSISSDGLTVAIGATGNDNGGVDAGHVRVYNLIGGVWVQQGQDIVGERASDHSGISVSVSTDGLTVAVGASGNDDGGVDAGHVRIYKYIAGVWTQQGADIDGEAAGDGLGRVSISMSADGLTVAIGARFNDGGGNLAGHVRVYKYIGGDWTQQGADIDGEAAVDGSGFSISMSADGSTVVIGATGNDGGGSSAGHVRVFLNKDLLSIASNNFGPQFKVYPNPSNGSINIELGSLYQDVNISIFDLLGKEMIHKTYINTNKIILDTQQLTTGVYIVKVESNTNKASLKLVVK